MKTLARLCAPEVLESRIAPAVHTWIGAGSDNLWSNAANWLGGSPATDISGDIDLVFPTNAPQLLVQNDIAGLVVDSITFSATGGTSASGYTINGNAITINTAAAGQDPFGIDVVPGVADPANGITQVFNAPVTLINADATIRSQENNSRLTFNGDMNLSGRTLTVTVPGTFNHNIEGVVINGDISSGNLLKTGAGTLHLTGDNTFSNATANSGNILVSSDAALGATGGILTINDPGRVILINDVTVVKALLNLNSNQLLGGLGADGNSTSTFRGSVILMAGAGGVALGSGSGLANANTRLVIDGVISGATSTLSLNGAGVIEFTKNNTYTGNTNHNGNLGFGALQINAPGGLGAGGPGNESQFNRNGAGPTGSALWLNFDGALRDAGGIGEDIRFAGSGVGGLGAVRVLGDHDVILPGNIVHTAGAPWVFGVDGENGSLITTGVIDSQGANRALTKVGQGTLAIGGVGANTYLDGTIINGGIVSVQNSSPAPLGNAGGVVTVFSSGTLEVEAGITIPNAVALLGGTLAGSGTVAGAVTSIGGIVSPGPSTAMLTVNGLLLNSTSRFQADVSGPLPGTQHDQIRVAGSVDLAGAALSLAGGFAAAPGDTVVLIDNDAADAVIGTFAGLPEGATIPLGGSVFSISYAGGTGNDVVLTAISPQTDLQVAGNGKSASFTDVDGDLVTVKLTKGTLSAADFTFGFTADNRQQLQQLIIDAADAGTNLTITARPTASGGDGFVSVGYISATGVALGVARIDGDLGRIDAAAVKSLTVQSIGALGATSQPPGGTLVSNFSGKLGKLTVKASIHGATILGAESIGTVNVLGSFLGGRLSAGADLGAVSVRGDMIGTAANPLLVSAFGGAVPPATGLDVAIKSLKVSGGVEGLRVLAGHDLPLSGLNADAAIGSISVGADWRASTVLAGVGAGADGFAGTPDDAKFTAPGTRDTAEIFSTIARLTIKGQTFGSTEGGDTFGIVAERIGAAKIGKAVLSLAKGARDATDVFALAPTGPGATGLASDFFLREAIV